MASSVTDRKRVYIACPISRPDTVDGLLNNSRQVDHAMWSLMRLGFAPFNPALSVYAGGAVCSLLPISEDGGNIYSDRMTNFAVANRQANGPFTEFTHSEWLDMDFAWVAVSDAVLRLPGDSTGADMETAFATERGIPVFYSIDDLKTHFGDSK